jgi:cytochrome bd-type quinol oxidase subunit 2
MEVFRFLVGIAMLGILVSLGSALFHLMTDKGDSKKMVRALTVRVGLSVALFLLLMGAWALGFIQPLAAVPR